MAAKHKSKPPKAPPTSEARARAQKTEVEYTLKCGLCDITTKATGAKELRKIQACKGEQKVEGSKKKTAKHPKRYMAILRSKAVKVPA